MQGCRRFSAQLFYLTTSTGQGAYDNTPAATLPRISFSRSDLPLEPITIRSALSSRAYLTISAGTDSPVSRILVSISSPFSFPFFWIAASHPPESFLMSSIKSFYQIEREYSLSPKGMWIAYRAVRTESYFIAKDIAISTALMDWSEPSTATRMFPNLLACIIAQ